MLTFKPNFTGIRPLLLAMLLVWSTMTVVRGQDLFYAEKSLPEIYDPIFGSRSITGARVAQLIHAGLYGEGANGVVIPMLAAKFPLYNQDYTAADIELRPGIKWSDGSPITADDIYFSYVLHKSKTMGSASADYLTNIKSIKVVNPGKLHIETETREQELHTKLTFNVLSRKQVGTPSYTNRADFLDNILTAGRYKIISKSASSVELSANNWFENAPTQGTVRTIKIDAVHDENARIQDFMTLVKNFILDIPALNLTDIKMRPEDFGLRRYAANELAVVVLNNENPFFKIEEVRQAMTYLFDRQAAKDNYYHEKIDIVSGPFAFGSKFYDETISPFPYDVAKAKQLLRGAGCTWDGDNKLLYQGERVDLDIIESKMKMTNHDDIILNVFKSALESVGFDKVQLFSINDDVQFMRRLATDKNFDMAFTYFQYPNDYCVITLYGSESISQGYNFAQYSDSVLDKLLEELERITNNSLAIETGKKIHARLHDAAPVIFLWSYNRVAAFNYHQLDNINLGQQFLFNSITSWMAMEH